MPRVLVFGGLRLLLLSGVRMRTRGNTGGRWLARSRALTGPLIMPFETLCC